MTYLSRIWINPRRAQSQRFERDPQALHAAVLAGIPAQPVRERVLWRRDLDEPMRPALLVLSESHPSWEHLVEQAGWPSASDLEDPQVLVRPYEPLLQRLAAGDEYAFRLTANPVKATRTRDDRARLDESGRGGRSPRRGQVTVAQQIDWLTSRAPGLGFSICRSSASDSMGEEVPDLRIVTRDRRSFRRGHGNSQQRVTLQVVTYEGRLRIDDPAVLAERLVAGIGPAKAYGCGLMTLAPLPAT